MKPLIALTVNEEEETASINHAYARCVVQAGGIPLYVPFGLGEEELRSVCGATAGLLLTGGPDLDPVHYGEEPQPGLGRVTPERDRTEMLLVQTYVVAEKPIFAICRGEQLLNVALGGTLHQDLHTLQGLQQHSQKAPRSHLSHSIAIEPGSRLAGIAGSVTCRVNSFHHQAVKQAAPGMRVTARSADGVIEAIESEDSRFILGVQWHPEHTAATDEVSRRLFEAFVQACKEG